VRHVLSQFGGGDASLFLGCSARFVKPVAPGETLLTRMWRDDSATPRFRVGEHARDPSSLERNAAAARRYVTLPLTLPEPLPIPDHEMRTGGGLSSSTGGGGDPNTGGGGALNSPPEHPHPAATKDPNHSGTPPAVRSHRTTTKTVIGDPTDKPTPLDRPMQAPKKEGPGSRGGRVLFECVVQEGGRERVVLASGRVDLTALVEMPGAGGEAQPRARL